MNRTSSPARRLTILGAFVLSLTCQLVWALENDAFSFGIGGTKPVLWKEYEPLTKSLGACMKDNQWDSPTCRRVQDQSMQMMNDAILQAVMLNVNIQNSSEKFCDKTSTDLVRKHESGQLTAYAFLLVEKRLKYGAGLYGARLPETYLGKIVFDALRDESPCK